MLNLFLWFLRRSINFKKNPYHPLAWINGDPEIGKNVYISGFVEIYAKGANVSIGDNCDIGSFTVINCADSHLKTIGKASEIDRKHILIEHNVFVGSQVMIKGETHIGHNSVIAAGTVMGSINVPPYSLVYGNPATVKEGYYLGKNNSA